MSTTEKTPQELFIENMRSQLRGQQALYHHLGLLRPPALPENGGDWELRPFTVVGTGEPFPLSSQLAERMGPHYHDRYRAKFEQGFTRLIVVPNVGIDRLVGAYQALLTERARGLTSFWGGSISYHEAARPQVVWGNGGIPDEFALETRSLGRQAYYDGRPFRGFELMLVRPDAAQIVASASGGEGTWAGRRPVGVLGRGMYAHEALLSLDASLAYAIASVHQSSVVPDVITPYGGVKAVAWGSLGTYDKRYVVPVMEFSMSSGTFSIGWVEVSSRLDDDTRYGFRTGVPIT